MHKNLPIMLQTLFVFCLSFGLWIIFSGIFKPLMIILGILSSVIVTYITIKMFKVAKQNYFFFLKIKSLKYFAWLIKEMFVSSFRIIYAITVPKCPDLKPTLFKINTNLDNIGSLALYANSITYTPGTFSVIVRDKYIVVHALTLNARQALLSGEMHNRVEKLNH